MWEVTALPKILIIEDEPDMVLGLRRNFEYEGYEVSTAGDGEEGLKRALKEFPDLIILDVMLPKLSGIDVCRRLRGGAVETPIIMLTARGQEIDKVLGLEMGADDYVTKPFSVRELLARACACNCGADPHPRLRRPLIGSAISNWISIGTTLSRGESRWNYRNANSKY